MTEPARDFHDDPPEREVDSGDELAGRMHDDLACGQRKVVASHQGEEATLEGRLAA